jgi:putative flippase GtrA
VPHAAFLRYALTGGLATVLHYGLLLALVERLLWPPGLAAALGACAGALLAYAGNRRFTFAAGQRRHRAALPRFALVALAGALLNGLIVGALSRLGLHYLLAQLLATLAVLLLGFRINKRWTFA